MENGCGKGDGGEEDLWAPVVSRGDAPPVLEPAEHDLDAVPAFVAALIMFEGRLPCFRPGMQTCILLSFNRSRSRSAS